MNDTTFPLTKVYILDTALSFYTNGIIPKNRTGFMMSCVVVFEKKECKKKEFIYLNI